MASTYLSRTLGTPTNAYKGTLSYWQKAASTTATNYILACESGNERMLFYMAAGKFQAGLRGTSSPDHPETELAYITKAEKDLLLKKDLHNSLEGTPNKGPGELISLNGWGDASDGFGGSGGTAGPGDTGGEGGNNPSDGSDSQTGGNGNNDGPQVAPGEAPVSQEEIDEFNKGPTADGDALDMQDYLTDYVEVNEKKQQYPDIIWNY